MKKIRCDAVFSNNTNLETYEEIIDDEGVIDCLNQLNAARESDDQCVFIVSEGREPDRLSKINRINAEMRWFSQWLTAKVSSTV